MTSLNGIGIIFAAEAGVRGIHNLLFLLVSLAVAFGFAVLVVWLFPGYPNAALLVSLAMWSIGMLKARNALERRAMERRIAPVLEVLKKVGPMASSEKDYHRVLIEQFFVDLTAGLKPESPLSTGTRVDAWMSYDGDDWYITVKRGLTNQQRLCLQGEIEDSLLHSPKRGKDLWVVVILGIPDNVSGVTLGQINALMEYAAHRAAEISINSRKRNANIEIVPVELVSS